MRAYQKPAHQIKPTTLSRVGVETVSLILPSPEFSTILTLEQFTGHSPPRKAPFTYFDKSPASTEKPVRATHPVGCTFVHVFVRKHQVLYLSPRDDALAFVF